MKVLGVFLWSVVSCASFAVAWGRANFAAARPSFEIQMSNKTFADTKPMSQRAEDISPETHIVKVTREIPLPWLIGGVIAFIFNTAQSWQSQTALEKQLSVQAVLIDKLSDKIEKANINMSQDGGIRAQKDSEHDFRIQALTNRIAAIESAVTPRVYIPPQQYQPTPQQPQTQPRN